MKNIKLGDELTVGYDIFDKYGNFVAGGTRVIALSDEVSDEYLKVRIKGEKDTMYCIPPEVFKDESNESVKDDFKDDKLRWDLLPLEEIEEVVRVLHAGAKKYGPNRWQNSLQDKYLIITNLNIGICFIYPKEKPGLNMMDILRQRL